jgi:hypothetical protein
MDGGQQIEREAEDMHPPPERGRDPVARERRHLDRKEQVERDDSERDGHRMPRRSQGHEHLREPEVHVGVADDCADVDHGEDEGETAEEAVQVEKPGSPHPPPEGSGRHGQAPQDRSGEEGPRNDTGRAGDIPGEELCAHSA